MIPNIGPMEIAIVLILALVIFGPKKLPSLGHSLGNGIREFRHGLTTDKEPDKETAANKEPEVIENREVAG